MSFATGLFSFGAGLSTQFREEVDKIDLEKQAAIERSIAKSQTDFENTMAVNEQLMKDKDLSLKQDRFAFDKEVENNKQANLNADRLIKLDELDFKKSSFAKTHGLDVQLFELNSDEFAQAKSEFMAKLGLDEKQYELNKDIYDETVRFNKEKIRLEEYEAMMDAEKGVTTYRGISEGNSIKINSSGDSETERLFSKLSSYNTLTNEQIKLLEPTAQAKLQKDIRSALGQLKLKSYDDTNKTYIDFTLDYPNLFGLDVLNETFQAVFDDIKNDQKQILNESGVKADEIALVSDGKNISALPMNYQNIADQAGFDTPEQASNSIQKLVSTNNKYKSFTSDLSPFRDAQAVYTTFVQEGIPFSMLKLAPELDYLQELPANSSVNAQYYANLVEKAEDLGIIGPNGENADVLFNMIYKVQPMAEVIARGGSIKTAETPKDAGFTIDQKAASSQYEAASNSILTIDELILRIDSLPDDRAFGLAMSAASIFEKVKDSAQGVQMLISRVESNEVDMTAEARQKFIDGLKSISTQGLAEESARIGYLKFSLAYQMSMALQGGSGGRTISDQDVDNMLRALNMDGVLQDADQVKASLTTIKQFMTGIANRSKYEAMGDMKGYRTKPHVIGVMNALSIGNLSDLAQELEEKVYGEVGESLTGMDSQSIGINDWNINRDTNGDTMWRVFQKDGYPYVSFVDKNKGNYFMTQEMLDNYKDSDKGSKNSVVRDISKIPDGPFPNSLIGLGDIEIKQIGQ